MPSAGGERSVTAKCEMVHIHHSDCGCQWCAAGLDEGCRGHAVAALADGRRIVTRVCDDCAIRMHLDGVYVIRRDDGRPVMSS
jgi:hypothetical protein